jgi:hypothetical protein
MLRVFPVDPRNIGLIMAVCSGLVRLLLDSAFILLRASELERFLANFFLGHAPWILKNYRSQLKI